MARTKHIRCFLTSLIFAVTGTGAVYAQSEHPIVVFVAKIIYTMDPGWPSATAVAVRDGKILSVGSMEDLQPWLKGREYKVIDSFKNKILFPGFIESHGHPFLGGTLMRLPLLTHYDTPNPYGPPFKGLKSRQAALTKLKQYESALADPKELLVAWGFDSVVYGGHLTRQELDKISSTRPIIVWDASEHFAYLNSAVIKQRGYTSELAKKITGVRLGSDGELNGQFLGTTAATFALGDFLKSRSEPEQAKKSLDFMIDLSVQGGITTQSELVLGIINPESEARMYREYFNDPKTPMRLVAVSDIEGLNAAKKDKAVDYILELQQQSTDKIIFRGVKSFSDDSFLGFGMMVDNPGYINGREGIFINKGEEFVQQLLPYWKAGLQIHVHTNGNRGNENTVDVLAALQSRHPRFDHRFTLQHYGISTPSQAKRLKALGALVSINPYYLYQRAEINREHIGTERAYLAARYRTLLDVGVPTTMHSDTPIGPAKPLEWVWIAVNRFGQSGKTLAPAERITIHEAMRMITIDAAYSLGVDDLIGSIEPGKFADFTVLEQDPYQSSPEKLRDIQIWGTVVGGKVNPVGRIRPQ